MSGNSRKLLLLEPVDTIRRTLSAFLESNGFEVEAVATEAEAIARVRGGFGAVIIDVSFDQRRGFGVTEHIVAQIPEILPRVIVMTADDSERVRAELERIGVCGIVPKPIHADEILQAVRECLQTADATLH